jgi:hypothetical protein
MKEAAEGSSTLNLVKPRLFKCLYEFRVGDETVGQIKYSGFGDKKAEAKLFNEEWKFQQTGFWKPFLEYKAGQSPYDKGKIRARFSCAMDLTGRDGKKYLFKKTAWWKNSWGWYDEAGNILMTIKENLSLSKKQAVITLNDPSQKNNILFILIGTAMMLIHKRSRMAAMSA